MHNKLLTTGNIRKRGIVGPFQCALCNLEEETSNHIFLQCSVSLNIWQCILPPGFKFRPPGSVAQLIEDWAKHLPNSLIKKPILGCLWNTIPKNLCWQLWIARNKSIFKDQKVVPTRIVSKTVGMIAEKFASRDISFPVSEDIPEPHSSWCKIFLKERSPPQSKFPSSRIKHSSSTFPWEIRNNCSEFRAWLLEINSYAFFFDGASKGNPGVAGVGGILLNPRGQIEQTFSWGLGHRTNNEAEWLALL